MNSLFLKREFWSSEIPKWGMTNFFLSSWLRVHTAHTLSSNVSRIHISYYSWKSLESSHQPSLIYFKVSYFNWLRRTKMFPSVLAVTRCNCVSSRWQPSMKWVCMPWRTLWPADLPRGWWPLLKVSGDPPQVTISFCDGQRGPETEILTCQKQSSMLSSSKSFHKDFVGKFTVPMVLMVTLSFWCRCQSPSQSPCDRCHRDDHHHYLENQDWDNHWLPNWCHPSSKWPEPHPEDHQPRR